MSFDCRYGWTTVCCSPLLCICLLLLASLLKLPAILLSVTPSFCLVAICKLIDFLPAFQLQLSVAGVWCYSLWEGCSWYKDYAYICQVRTAWYLLFTSYIPRLVITLLTGSRYYLLIWLWSYAYTRDWDFSIFRVLLFANCTEVLIGSLFLTWNWESLLAFPLPS